MFSRTLYKLTFLTVLLISSSSTGQRLASSPSIILTSDVAGSEYDLLLKVAIPNQIPVGIVLASSKPDPACGASSSLKAGSHPLSEVIKELNDAFPAGRLSMAEGVLHLQPRFLSKSVSNYLDTIIPEFKSESASHSVMGINLWMFVQAQLFPGKGASFAGATDPTIEKLPDVDTKNLTVQQNLDKIAGLGKAGAWVLKPATIEASKANEVPYTIAGYSGLHLGSEARQLCSAR